MLPNRLNRYNPGMVEISSYTSDVHERFAHDQQEIEAFQRQYQVLPERARDFAVQTQVLDATPRYPEWAQLLQVYQKKLWAYFVMPVHYTTQRFSSAYVAPSFGTVERLDADINKIEAFVKNQTQGRQIRRKEERQPQGDRQPSHPDEELLDESEAIIDMISKGIKEPNEMVNYILSRMRQFVQA